MISRPILVFLLINVAFSATSSVVWRTSSGIQCGSQTMVTTTVSATSSSYSIVYATVFATIPTCVPGTTSPYVGITDFAVDSATANYLAFLSNLGASTKTGVSYSIQLRNSTVITSWRASYFCYQSTVVTFLTSGYSGSSTYSSTHPIYSGSGYRQVRRTVPMSGFDYTRAIYFLPFLTQVTLYRPSLSDSFVFKVSMETIANGYDLIHATDGNCQVQAAAQYRITLDQTAVQASQIYLDVQFFAGINSTPNPSRLVFSDKSSYVCGINHFNFAGTMAPQFRYDPVTFVLASTGYVFLNLTTVNFRQHVCTSPTIYFMELENLCYDECPSGYFPFTNNLYCYPCSLGCLTCTDSSSSSCSSCNATANRALSGSSCPCMTGFYDSGVLQCQTCNVRCQSCANTSTNCTACRSNTFRTQSGNACPCDSGYVDTGSTVCAACSVIPGCLTCTSTTNCATCDSSKYMTVNTTSRLCVCSTGNSRNLIGGLCACLSGYTDVGTATCATCSSQMSGCLQCSSKTECTVCNVANNWKLSNKLCVCDTGYIQSSQQCVVCSQFMPGCQECSSQTVCSKCDSTLNRVLNSSGSCACSSGYAVNNSLCAGCGTLINGCSMCSSSSACTTCDAGLLMELSGSGCACISGYTLVGSTCTSCSSLIPDCLTCSSSSVCATCNSTKNLMLSGSQCVCATGYTNSSGSCTACSAFIGGCTACSSTSVCTACNAALHVVLNGSTCSCASGYATSSGQCATCSSLINHCSICSSSTNCTTCATGFHINQALTCTACGDSIPGCLECSSATVCTLCDTNSDFTLSASKCVCETGLFLNSTTKACDSCSVTLTDCTLCSSPTVCTQCVVPLTFIGGRCQCSNIHQYYNQSQAACVDCGVNCNSCTNGSACLTCNSSLFRVLNSTTGDCVCKLNYQQDANGACVPPSTCVNGFVYNGAVCQEICGDGLLFELECDDGNLQSGDGCSAACTVQANFTCRGGSGSSASKCSYNQPLQLSLASSQKDLYANAINFTLRVAPVLKILKTFKFSQILSSNLPSSSIKVTYASGQLLVRVVYQQSIQNASASLNVAPPTSLDNTFEMKASSASFVVNPDNAEAYYYSEGTYASATSMRSILKICMGAAFATLILGVIYWKLVGVEASHVMQILFLASSLVPSLPPPLAPASELWPTLGYNNMFTDFPGLYDFGAPELPKTLTQMQLGVRFVQNCNYMIAGQLVVVIVGGIIYLLGRALTNYSESLSRVAKFVLVEVLMVLVLFNCLGVGFSLGLHILYWNRPQTQPIESQIINLVPAAVVLVMAVVHFWLMYKHDQYLEHTNKTLKHNKLSQMHPAVLFSARFLTGLTISVLSEFKYGLAGPAGIQLIFLVFMIVKRPYRKTIMSIRAIINESVIAVIFAVTIAYNFDVMNASAMAVNSQTEWMSAPAWCETAFVIAALLFNLVCQVYAIYKATCSNKTAEVNPQSPVKQERLPAQSSSRQGDILVEDISDAQGLEISRQGSTEIKLDSARQKKPKRLRYPSKKERDQIGKRNFGIHEEVQDGDLEI